MQGLPQEEGHGRERWPLGVAIDLRGNQVRPLRPWLCALDLPETEAPHPGVSSGGVEVEGAVFVRASLTGNGSPSGRQLGRAAAGGGVRRSTLTPSTPAQILAALATTGKGT